MILELPEPVAHAMRRVEADAALPLMRTAGSKIGRVEGGLDATGRILLEASASVTADAVVSTHNHDDASVVTLTTSGLTLEIAPKHATESEIALVAVREGVRWTSVVSIGADMMAMAICLSRIDDDATRREIAAQVIRSAGRAAHRAAIQAEDPVQCAKAEASATAEWDIMFGALTLVAHTRPETADRLVLRPRLWYGRRSLQIRDQVEGGFMIADFPEPPAAPPPYRLASGDASRFDVKSPDHDMIARNPPMDPVEALHAIRDPILTTLTWRRVR